MRVNLRKVLFILPNLFTLSSIFCGFYAAVLCLGAIIRGETTHDQHIARAVGGGIEAIARTWGLPVLFGVLTCDTLAQALARAGGDASSGYAGNKGKEHQRRNNHLHQAQENGG